VTQLAKWSDATSEEVNGYEMNIFVGDPKKTTDAIELLADAIPSYYAAPNRVADLLRKHGREGVAKYLEEKLPTAKSIRSGDLGEILGVAYLHEHTPFIYSVKRLRWKDHRNMSMRGEDLLAFSIDKKTKKLLVVKGEVKSRATLSGAVVEAARKALSANHGMPSAHAMSFLADRFFEQGDKELADMLDNAQLKKRISKAQLTHLMFTFSGNNPTNLLRRNLLKCGEGIHQIYVGLQVAKHQEFIKSVFDTVDSNGL
jgi:hypothetical protein